MSESELLAVIYSEIINQVKKLYGLKAEMEHDFIHEFFEGSIPLFKLILVSNDEGPGFVMASFHIDVEASDAIQWFMRVRSLDSNLRVTACYLRDSSGASYVGEDAQVLKLYMMEQDIVSTFIQGNKDPEDIVNRHLVAEKPSQQKTYSDYDAAIHEFNKMRKRDGDVEH